MKIKKPRDWFKKSAEIEGDSEIGAGESPPPITFQPNHVAFKKKLDDEYKRSAILLESVTALKKENKRLQGLLDHEEDLNRRNWESKAVIENLYRESYMELNKANKGLRRLSAKLKRSKPRKDELEAAFVAGMRAVDDDYVDHIVFYNRWHKETYGPKSE